VKAHTNGPGFTTNSTIISLSSTNEASHALVPRNQPQLTAVHTLAYMRQHTVVLLSAVLAAASKLYRKDLWPQLLAHANTVLDRALLRGITHISLMQSLMILTYTKAPADTSAWRRIGMAIRMGYQMRLHVPRNSPLPEDVAAARVLLVSLSKVEAA